MATKHSNATPGAGRFIPSLLAGDIADGLTELTWRNDPMRVSDMLQAFDEAKRLMSSLAGVSEREYRRKHRRSVRTRLHCEGDVVI